MNKNSQSTEIMEVIAIMLLGGSVIGVIIGIAVRDVLYLGMSGSMMVGLVVGIMAGKDNS